MLRGWLLSLRRRAWIVVGLVVVCAMTVSLTAAADRLPGLFAAQRAERQWDPARIPASDGGSQRAPAQRTGTAAGRSHTVSAAATSAKGVKVTGRAPAAVPGELPEYKIPGSPSQRGRSAPGSAPGSKVKGFDARTSKEVESLRTESSKSFTNADGTMTKRVFNGPVHRRE
jgi:hypothetical protein